MLIYVKIFAAAFGFLGVLLGAFGAHRLKRIWEPEVMQSFETGVKYQFLHAIVLLVLGFHLDFERPLERFIALCFILGIVLFSFSIYGLCYSKSTKMKLRFLGPITPLGGLLLLMGWGLLLFNFATG